LKTLIVKIKPCEVEAQKIQVIADALSRGGVIAYPTDTYYGLGAGCFLRKPIRRIYRIKQRQMSQALPVLIADTQTVRGIAAEIPPLFRSLTAEFWPGPLTLVLKAAALLPSELVGPEQTIGVRLPAVAWLRELVRRTGFPVIATSANISGEGEISSVEKVVEVFEHKVDLIVDGGQTPGTLPSTVIDLTSGAPSLVRKGAIPKSRLKKYFT
jgi:L-threonylcarbamoyladenylate synthase